jgi:hypothetical protein
VLSQLVDIVVALPIIAAKISGEVLVGLAALPACAVAVIRVESGMAKARVRGDGPW